MLLKRTDPCVWFDMKSPIWGGGKRVVGLAANRIGVHNEITFSYVSKKTGKQSIPDHFYIGGDKIRKEKYPIQKLTSGMMLYLIPFSDLEVLYRIHEQVKQPEPEPEPEPEESQMRLI